MGLYDQNVVSGQETKWQRCRQMVSENPLNGLPSTTYIEEIGISLPDGSTETLPIPNLQPLTVPLNPNDQIPLYDFSTGVPVATGQTMSSMALGFALYSSYLYYAAQRDAAAAAAGASTGL